MMLSKNFSLNEFLDSETARDKKIKNEANAQQIEAMRQLCINVLQPLRDYFNKPVKITSGFRSAELNLAIGGAKTSQHTQGMAADIKVPGVSNTNVFLFIFEHLHFDQLIAEYLYAGNPNAGWIHVSFKAAGNRREVLSRTGRTINGKKYGEGLHYVDRK